jgi:uncharacterized protein with PIN domain
VFEGVSERIETGYRGAFRTLLARVQPRRLEFGVELLVGRARERAARDGKPLRRALYDLFVETRGRVEKRVALIARCSVAPPPVPPPSRFFCDCSLGGLARWLWAAGQAADVARGLRGDALVAEALRLGAALLTGDASLVSRREVREGRLTAVWVPTGLALLEQLDWVRHALPFPLGDPRCMGCGGELLAAEKASVGDRIPPRTALWKDRYWTCARCGRLFWEGTHWERIVARLREIQAA